MSIKNVTEHSRISSTRLVPALFFTAAITALSLAGCKGNATAANPADGTTASDSTGQDPTLANMAPVDDSAQAQGNPTNSYATSAAANQQGPTQVKGYQQQAQPTQQSYNNAAPIERRVPSSNGQAGYADPNYSDQASNGQSGASSNYGSTDDDYDAEAGYNATLSDISAPQPPPPLPTYEQPEAPDPNYLWTPGYWSYTSQGYYWVPGAWAQPPYTGALWTPGYWGGYGNGYRFHRGFWATHIGFYGGINYGFGFFGTGYQGGYWNGDNFYYNRECNRINERVIRNVYQRNVVINNRVVNNTTINNTTINNRTINNVSYNGGRGGVQVRPRPAELAVLREQRVPPMREQLQHQQQAAQNRQQFFAQNHGRPALVAAVQPLRADRGIIAPAHTTAQLNRALPVAQQIQQERQFVRPAAPADRSGATVAQPGNRGVAVQQLPQQRPGVAQQRPGEQRQPNQPAPRQVPAQGQTIGQSSAQRPGQPVQQQGQRPGQQQGQRPSPVAQPARPSSELSHPVTTPEQVRPQPQQQPKSVQPLQRPAYQRPQTVEPTRQQPETRTVPQQQVRPQPQVVRPQTEQVRPQPQARPDYHPQEARPQQQQVRPQPQSRPELQPQQARPQPQMQQARPQPQVQQARPQPQQQARPQPQQHTKPEPHVR